MNFTKKTRRPKIQMLTPCTSSILDERNAHLFWRHCPLRCQRRAPSLFARAPTHSPNCSQGEVNRQSSTSSAPSFLRWVGDESRTDDKKKAAKCVAAPQLLSLAFFLSVAPLNVSFIQNQSKNLRPPPLPPATPCCRKSNRTARCRSACGTHNMGSQFASHLGAVSNKRDHRTPLMTWAKPSQRRNNPHSWHSVHFVRKQVKRNKINKENKRSKWARDHKEWRVCKTGGQKLSVACGKKAAYANYV